MIMIPVNEGARQFAIDWFVDDLTRGLTTPAEASEMLGQLRIVGDVANLERLSRLLAEHGRG